MEVVAPVCSLQNPGALGGQRLSRACVCVLSRVCVCACMRVCVCVCVCVCMYSCVNDVTDP